MRKKMISAKEIMERYNLTYQAINHYTNFGLLGVTGKKGNVRMYDAHEVRKRLSAIVEMAGEGYSLRLIRKKLIGI